MENPALKGVYYFNLKSNAFVSFQMLNGGRCLIRPLELTNEGRLGEYKDALCEHFHGNLKPTHKLLIPLRYIYIVQKRRLSAKETNKSAESTLVLIQELFEASNSNCQVQVLSTWKQRLLICSFRVICNILNASLKNKKHKVKYNTCKIGQAFI